MPDTFDMFDMVDAFHVSTASLICSVICPIISDMSDNMSEIKFHLPVLGRCFSINTWYIFAP